jgi:hypothetical protein
MIKKFSTVLESMPKHHLYAIVLICDLSLFTITAWFEHFTLLSIVRHNDDVVLLSALLAANLLLLAVVFGAMFVNGVAIRRFLVRR